MWDVVLAAQLTVPLNVSIKQE